MLGPVGGAHGAVSFRGVTGRWLAGVQAQWVVRMAACPFAGGGLVAGKGFRPSGWCASRGSFQENVPS